MRKSQGCKGTKGQGGKRNTMRYQRGGDVAAPKPKTQPKANTSASREEIKRLLMQEMARRNNPDPGVPSAAKQKMMSQRMQEQDMDKRMQEAAAKRRTPNYKIGGKVNPKSAMAMRRMAAKRGK